jgi:S-phase kinase-associated protein 1
MSDLVPPWDAAFVDIDNDLLFELIFAANFMDMRSLLDLTCGKVAAMVRNKAPEDLRKEFSIRNDFTPEEEVRKEKREKRKESEREVKG